MKAAAWITPCLLVTMSLSLLAQPGPNQPGGRGGGRPGQGGPGAPGGMQAQGRMGGRGGMQGQQMQLWQQLDKEACFKSLDPNQDGKLSKEEFDAADLGAVFTKALAEAGRKARQQQALMRQLNPVQHYDKDDNLVVTEDELAEGLETQQRRLGKLKPFLLEEFDEDKDGEFSPEEARSIQAFFGSIGALVRFDNDRSWTLNEDEMDAAWDVMSEICLRSNEFMVNRFDADGDGELSPEETEKAKTQMRQVQLNMRRQGQRGQGGPGARGPGGGPGRDGGPQPPQQR